MSRNKPVTKLAVVDIETLDKTPSAVIFAIGCVIVDIEQLEITNEFYTVINPNQKGRTAGNGTPEWWLKQSLETPEAFEQLQAAYGSNKTLKAALYEFGAFLTEEFNGSPINMFGNGPEFDNVVLTNAFEWAGLKTPWPYWGNQSIRTSNLLAQLAGHKIEREFVGIKHHALDDAYHEAFLLIDAIKCFKPDENSKHENPVYIAPTKQIADEWAKNNFEPLAPKINSSFKGENFKSACASVEQAVKKLNDAFRKGIKIENEQQKESSDPYVSAFNSIIGALDSGGEEWRKPNQETRSSAVEKVREMAALINAFDMGELQESHKNMEAITAKLRNDGFDVKSPAQLNRCVQSLTFKNENLKEQAHCFDELQKLLRSISEGSFERECASSLLDDCKHAIGELLFYKKEINKIKAKLESVSNSENISIKS